MLFAALALAADPVFPVSAEVAHARATVDALTPESCGADLDGLFTRIRALDPRLADPDDVASHGGAALTGLFEVRLALQDQLNRFHAAGQLTDACITGARRTDLATRYVADHLVMAGVSPETSVGRPAPAGRVAGRPLRRPEIPPEGRPSGSRQLKTSWLTTPSFRGFEDLQAGDVLVTRGDALSSAGIAHMGRVDTQFSHNAMVHAAADGKLWTVEAYLEKGGVTQPVEEFLAHGLGRVVVLRYEDPALAAKGAALAYERVAAGGIDYDERFDHRDDGELFCSEVAPWALRLAGGPDDVPLHPTVFPRAENPSLFAALGIDADVYAAPADLLVDPRFRIVGEWRSPDALETMRRHDAVTDAVMRWMEQDGYVLEPVWANAATVDVGLAVRRTPILGALVADRLHPHGDRTFLVGGLALNEAGIAVHAALEERLAGREGTIPWDALQSELESIRQEDLARWEKRPRKARFHRVLHPAPTASAKR